VCGVRLGMFDVSDSDSSRSHRSESTHTHTHTPTHLANGAVDIEGHGLRVLQRVSRRLHRPALVRAPVESPGLVRGWVSEASTNRIGGLCVWYDLMEEGMLACNNE
jgi:hypothetical protein